MIKNILSIETTSNICGVAIVSNNKIIYELNLNTGYNHSITLFDAIQKALLHCNLDLKNISKIKVSAGPGSFTGIRIGIAAAIGLSKAYNTKIEYVDTLDSLCYNVRSKNNYILSMIDAKSGRVYMGIYESISLNKIFNDFVIDIDNLINLLNKYFYNKKISFSFVGDGAVKYSQKFTENLKINFKIFNKYSNLTASSVAFTNGIISNIPKINYIIPSKAEQEKNGSNNICKK